MESSDVKTENTEDESITKTEPESEPEYSIDNLPPLIEYEITSSYDINSEIESEITKTGSKIVYGPYNNGSQLLT